MRRSVRRCAGTRGVAGRDENCGSSWEVAARLRVKAIGSVWYFTRDFQLHENTMKVFTAAQMREFDRVAIEEYGIPSMVLMENAALRVVEFLEAKFAPLRGKNIVICAAKGIMAAMGWRLRGI
jgi:hypothetical protein